MRIWISIISQSLELYDDYGSIIRRYAVSTARNGSGEQRGSYRTPRGRHIVRAKIGAGLPENAVLVGRRPTGETWSPALAAEHPDRDWILTRILWLSGCQPGFNRLGDCDTMRRYIYIHGSPDTVAMGTPGSIGCVRMRNADIVELFERVPPRTPVDIVEYAVEDGDWATLGAAAGRVRDAVFVREQGVPPEMEYDADDDACRHVLATDSTGAAVGTGRLLPTGRIGRMAVLPAWRGKGVGRALLGRLLELARRDRMDNVSLHAQVAAAGFYLRFGFVESGSQFAEAGIAHVRMTRAV